MKHVYPLTTTTGNTLYCESCGCLIMGSFMSDGNRNFCPICWSERIHYRSEEDGGRKL